MVRSGLYGRRCLATVGKRAIADAIHRISPDNLYWQAISGTSSVSFSDVLHLAHVKPRSPEYDAVFAYLMGLPFDINAIPAQARAFEQFKAATDRASLAVPVVDFRRLDNLGLTADQWGQAALNMSWNQLRLNLNNLASKKAFESSYLNAIADKLASPPAEVRTLPFNVYTSLIATQLNPEIPQIVKAAASMALDRVASDTMTLQGHTVIMVDVSGSMGCKVAKGSMSCGTAAIYFAASLVKSNPTADVTAFTYDHDIYRASLNPLDTVENIIDSMQFNGGGTATALCVQKALDLVGRPVDQLIVLSDNESWLDGWSARKITRLQDALEEAKKANPDFKFVGWDLQPTTSSQQDLPWALKVTGFSDSVFDVIEQFFTANQDFVQQVHDFKI
jgi:60 kDa SS-A/Ro ribonucleoprotein